MRKAMSAPLFVGLLLGVGTTLAATRLGSDVFSDVPEGSYYDEALGDLYTAGIFKGDGGKFRPGDNVNRAELVMAMDRLRDELLGNGVSPPRASARSRASADSSPEAVSSSSKKASSAQGSMTTAGALRFTQGAYTAPENGGSITVTVSRAGLGRGTVEVDYAITAGTASAGTDFSIANGKLTFADSEKSKTFSVQVLDDSASEGNETVMVTLSNPTNTAILSNPSQATVTITDNESGSSGSAASSGTAASAASSNPAGTLGFSAVQYSINENGGSLTVTVNRTGGTNGTVAINYSTSNGSGQSGVDYSATSGTLTFNSGDAAKTFTVPVIDDASIDGARTFNLTLSGPTGGPSLGTTSALATIVDTDSATFGSGSIRFSKQNYEVTEGSGIAEITVQRVGGAQGNISVNYEVSVGTALPGQDFVGQSGTMTFLAGESGKVIRVQIIKDDKSDSGEGVNLTLSNVTPGGTLGSPSTSTLTIYD
jgi:hypothetical protein